MNCQSFISSLRMISLSKEVVIILLITCGLLPEIKGQEIPIYQKHNTYEQFVNPAITGRDRYGFLNISYRKNWVSTQYSPSIFAVGGSFRLGAFHFYTPQKMLNKNKFISRDRSGLGGLLMMQQNGPLNIYYSSFTYAYFIPFDRSKMTELSFGLSGILVHNSINESLLDPNDAGDPKLIGLTNQPWRADAGFGMYFHTKQFQIGASVNELFQTSSSLDNTSYFKNKRDYFFQAGYKFYLHYFDLEPFVYFAQIDDEPFYCYLQLKSYYRNYNWFSIAFRSTQSVILSMGIHINRMQVGYAYEQNLNSQNNQFIWIHEIMIGFNIGFFEPEGMRKTIRK
jgi:type IX secretion system PorP/SprF family membrane protein